MARIVSANESKRKKFTFTCDGELKDEFEKLRKELQELGLKIDLAEDFEKVVKTAVSEMKKAISNNLNTNSNHVSAGQES